MYRLIDVPVEENTGLHSRTTRYDGKHNPHVIRKAPFRVYEAMQPITSPTESNLKRLALRIEWPLPPDVEDGPCTVTITVNQGETTKQLKGTILIAYPVVPPAGRDTFTYTNWINPWPIADRHGTTMWSDEYWQILARYATLLHKGRQNTILLPLNAFFEKNDAGSPVLHRERLEHYVNTFLHAGFHWLEGGHFGTRGKGDNWASAPFIVRMTRESVQSDAGHEDVAQMATQLMEVIKANGWENQWLQHAADEPTDGNAEDYIALSKTIHKHMPGIPILEATMSLNVIGAVDIWCPKINEYQQHRAFFDKRKAAGDKVWTYTCLEPGGPWINRLLDQERLRP
ncbi:MAG: hypothetical protein MI741_12110, partial [Rhodospirillales bacterium]|nr:hypothetical protein [Rhodospirillales bacterium]